MATGFHQLLHYMLRWVGLGGGYGSQGSKKAYEELFKTNPESRVAAQQVLLKAAEIFDTECKGKAPPLRPVILRQIELQQWNF